MAAAQLPESMADGLSSMLGSLAGLRLASDADSEFLTNLESMLASKIRELSASGLETQAKTIRPRPEPAGADLFGNLKMPSPPAGGGAPGPGAAGPLPGPGGPPAAAPRGLPMAPPMPNPDELRRVLNVG
ncbi:MAG: hypothetical protein ACF8PN_08180 [Phycisphaerales bacterium]